MNARLMHPDRDFDPSRPGPGDASALTQDLALATIVDAMAGEDRFLAEVVAARQPPAVRGKRLRTYYFTQYDAAPPRFALQVSDRSLVARDWVLFLENRLRERFALEGVPLVIDLRERSGRRPASARGRRRVS